MAVLGPVRRCALVVRQGGWCAWCRCPLERDRTEIDHVIPRRQGGGDDDANLVACCSACNLDRPDGVRLDGLLAMPLDLGAGRELALIWYPWAAERFDASAQRKRAARARAPRGGGWREERRAIREEITVAVQDAPDAPF